MRTSIRPDEVAGLGRLTEEVYVCSAGRRPSAARRRAAARAGAAGPRGLGAAGLLRRQPLGAGAGAYFAGERVSFDLDVDAYAAAHGFTDFERDVYRALARVPYGEVVSYRDLAREAGRPNAYRAVGSAMARNALPVILPCHRVIKNDGRLGFYGDDPAWKERLLALEGVRVVEGRVT